MKAHVSEFVSPDVEDLEEWVPPDRTDVRVFIEFFVGDDTEVDGEEMFMLEVFTPKALARLTTETSTPIVGRHMVFVLEWDWPLIEQFIRDSVDSIEFASWDQLVDRLGRLARWEDEDYEPDGDET